MNPLNVQDDFWRDLKKHTAARIAMGRAGGSLPTHELLAFRLAHAEARDAVTEPFDGAGFVEGLKQQGFGSFLLRTCAADRNSFLQRPDFGRKLSEESLVFLKKQAGVQKHDVVFIVTDGLSQRAIAANAIPFLLKFKSLAQDDKRIGAIVVVENGRVALQDEIGETLQSTIAVSLIGERPGLGAADSMGCYFVYKPKVGKTDANRNCISNIRVGGVSPAHAAEKLFYLMGESLRLKLSGVGLKDVSSVEKTLPF